MRYFFLVLFSMVVVGMVTAQSPDSRVCSCLTTAVPDNFLDGTKLIYGSIGVVIRRGEELKPAQGQPVKFVIPKLIPKQGCGTVYRILIMDEAGNTVYENEDSYHEFGYTFEQCDKRFTVRLVATAQTGSGGNGNCSRRTEFYIRPVCNTASCNCDRQPSGGKITGTSINLNVEGKLVCRQPTATRKVYTCEYQLTNKTDCRMIVESVTVLGQPLGSTAFTIAPKARSVSFNTGVSTPLAQASPDGSSVYLYIRYKLNSKSCSAIIKIPYTACNQ
jgi:hypothetical protein